MNLAKLEKELGKIDLKPVSIGQNNEQQVKEPEKFLRGHLKALKFNSGNRRYLPYFNRLKQFYEAQKKEM